jgi:hypothetical protein
MVIVFLLGCQTKMVSDQVGGSHLTEIPSYFGNAGIIRNPISPSGLLDTNLLAKIKFIDYSYDFGIVSSGTQVTYNFKFENNGKVPLIISNANANCGCTVSEFPKYPVLPGNFDSIKVIFDTQSRIGFQLKKINITANTYPSQNILELKGQIIE